MVRALLRLNGAGQRLAKLGLGCDKTEIRLRCEM